MSAHTPVLLENGPKVTLKMLIYRIFRVFQISWCQSLKVPLFFCSCLQTGRKLKPRRDESSCCWMNWSYWSTNGTRWSGIWTPRKKSESQTEMSHRERLFFTDVPEPACRRRIRDLLQIHGASRGERSERGPWHEAAVATTALPVSPHLPSLSMSHKAPSRLVMF